MLTSVKVLLFDIEVFLFSFLQVNQHLVIQAQKENKLNIIRNENHYR